MLQGLVPLACELEEQLAEGLSRTEWSGLLKALDKLTAHVKDVDEVEHERCRGLTADSDSPVTKTSLGSGIVAAGDDR